MSETMTKRFPNCLRLFRVPVCTIGAFLICSCCTVLLCSGCSEDDDYEIYATLYGVVTDYETGIPLENASVVLSPSSLTVQTGSDGRFAFDNLDAQPYTITVQKAGYQPNRKTVTAISGESMEVNIPMNKIER